jgi:CheY-like chemotaxis protein
VSRVLVIDDETVVGTILRYAFANDGHETVVADSGPAGIEAAHSQHPDLIVLDLMMPSVSGFDVVEALRERAETARIPIIVMTARRISAEDHRRLDGAVTTIMEKGQFDRARFTSEVRRAMSGRQPAS